MEGFCRRVGTNREQAWALAKEDAPVYWARWRGAAKALTKRVQFERVQPKNVCVIKMVTITP